MQSELLFKPKLDKFLTRILQYLAILAVHLAVLLIQDTYSYTITKSFWKEEHLVFHLY